MTTQILLDAARAPNTSRVYYNAMRTFSEFCNARNISVSLPASSQLLISFINFLFENNYSHSTVITYLSAIAYEHKIRGFPSPADSFIVQNVLKGFKRIKGPARDTRCPITPQLLSEIVNVLPAVCFDVYESTLFTAVFCTTFFAFLRVCEVTANNQHEMGYALRLSDVLPGDNSIKITIRKSKTDRIGRHTSLVLTRFNNENICPVLSLSKYLNVRPKSLTPILFCHQDSSPLTRYQFSSVLKKALSHLAIQGRFTSHSFRIGAASTAARNGVPHDQIMQWGRWSSHAYMSYIRN